MRMKLIDENGRLFGLINLIDFFVLLFLLAMIPAIYFGYKIIIQKSRLQLPFGSDVKEIELNCKLIKLRPDIERLISVGDREIDEKGRVIGRILWLGGSEPYEGTPTLRQRSARFKLKARFKGTDIYYKDRVIDEGLEFIFRTDKYDAVVRTEDDITKMLNMRITLKDLDEDTVNLIAVGDREIDVKGRTIAEILKVGKPEDNSLSLDLSGGNFTIGKDVTKRQLATEMMLRCQVINENETNQIYYKGRRIIHNHPIEFATDKYKARGLISKTYELIPRRIVKWISLRVKFSGVISQVANAVQIGDVEKDYYGSPTARVIKIISNKSAETVAITEGRLVTLILPSQNDLEILLDVLCEARGETYYFKNNSVKMGNSITFSTELYSITGTIVGMEIK